MVVQPVEGTVRSAFWSFLMVQNWFWIAFSILRIRVFQNVSFRLFVFGDVAQSWKAKDGQIFNFLYGHKGVVCLSRDFFRMFDRFVFLVFRKRVKKNPVSLLSLSRDCQRMREKKNWGLYEGEKSSSVRPSSDSTIGMAFENEREPAWTDFLLAESKKNEWMEKNCAMMRPSALRGESKREILCKFASEKGQTRDWINKFIGRNARNLSLLSCSFDTRSLRCDWGFRLLTQL